MGGVKPRCVFGLPSSRSVVLAVRKPWSKMMDILMEKDGGDTELLVYTMTLINKVNNSNNNKKQQ